MQIKNIKYVKTEERHLVDVSKIRQIDRLRI